MPEVTLTPISPELDPMIETDDSFPEPEPEPDAPPPEPEPEPTAPPEVPEPDPQDAVQKRINVVVRKQREAERRETAALAREKALQDRLDALAETKPAPASTAEDGEAPKLEDFDSDAEFARAYTDYNTKQIAKQTAQVIREELAQDRKARTEREAQEKVDDQYNSFAREGNKKYPDFEAVALSPDMYDENGVVLNAVLNADNGIDIAHHLGQNPDVADEICQKATRNPMAAAIQLGQISAQLKAASAIRASTAPDPVPSLKGSDAGGPPDPNKETIEEFMARTQKERIKDLRLKP